MCLSNTQKKNKKKNKNSDIVVKHQDVNAICSCKNYTCQAFQRNDVVARSMKVHYGMQLCKKSIQDAETNTLRGVSTKYFAVCLLASRHSGFPLEFRHPRHYLPSCKVTENNSKCIRIFYSVCTSTVRMQKVTKWIVTFVRLVPIFTILGFLVK